MRLCYASCSEPSAQLIADEMDAILTVRSSRGDINWGRAQANTTLNPDIRNTTNKQRMRELFVEHGVPTAAPVSVSDLRSDFARGIPRKVVGRSEKHRKGRGFWLIETNQQLTKALQGTRRKQPATHFMEYVAADREYRVQVFLGKSIRISEKEFYLDSNGRKQYITKKPGDISLRRVRQAAKQAVKAVGLDFGAVDILARGDNNTEVWVLEVNAAPGLGGTMPSVYANAFIKWWEGEWNG